MGAIELALDITHSWIGDLRVVLVAPSGRSVPLHNRSGGDADNLIRSWSSAQQGELAVLVGEPGAGGWTLQVADLEARDVGKLNHWGLRIDTMP